MEMASIFCKQSPEEKLQAYDSEDPFTTCGHIDLKAEYIYRLHLNVEKKSHRMKKD